MSSISRLVFALALTLTAHGALLARPAPAEACGSYVSVDQARARFAAVAYLHARRPDASASVRAVKLDGDQAEALVWFAGKNGGSGVAQILNLARKTSGAWAVTGESYPFPTEGSDVLFASL